MTRPHEDIAHHTAVDHRDGGPAVAFAAGAWCAIDTVLVRSDRLDAGLFAYETLIEQARTSSSDARTAAVLRSHDDRRVFAIVELSGHDGFAHLQSAWDDHHLQSEHRTVAESSTLALYQVSDAAKQAHIDPATHDAYGFELLAQPASVDAADGFRGAVVFTSDGGTQAIAIYRFERPEQLQAARPNATRVYAVKTFARS